MIQFNLSKLIERGLHIHSASTENATERVKSRILRLLSIRTATVARAVQGLSPASRLPSGCNSVRFAPYCDVVFSSGSKAAPDIFLYLQRHGRQLMTVNSPSEVVPTLRAPRPSSEGLKHTRCPGCVGSDGCFLLPHINGVAVSASLTNLAKRFPSCSCWLSNATVCEDTILDLLALTNGVHIHSGIPSTPEREMSSDGTTADQ